MSCIKNCYSCKNEFISGSNHSKFCKECLDKSKIRYCNYCKKELPSDYKRFKYCNDCLNKKVKCSCGCENYLKEGVYIKGFKYIKGHGRKNRETSEDHKIKIGNGNRGKIRSEEAKEKDRLRNIGKIHSEETKNKMSKTAIKKGFGKWMKEVWKDPDSIFNSKEYRDKLSLSLQGHDTSQETKDKISIKNSGENNGFFNQHHTKTNLEIISKSSIRMWKNPDIKNKILKTWEILGLRIPDYKLDEKKLYYRKVEMYTNLSLINFYNKINPENKKIGRNKKDYSIDHKYSKIMGFINNIDPKIIGSYINLETIKFSENASKSRKCSIVKEELLKLYNQGLKTND